MSYSLGLDVGGTKIAGALFDSEGHELRQVVLPTPSDYRAFLSACHEVITLLRAEVTDPMTIGVGAPFAVANMPFLCDKPIQLDLELLFGQSIALSNDANCAALAEAIEGAGKGFHSIFGLILGTGVAGGFIVDGSIFAGANGLCGEIGHLPLPYYEPLDGERIACGCGQIGCIEKLVAGPALARLCRSMIGEDIDARDISERARAGDAAARGVLDRFYTVVAKAMITVIHSFDPEIITVSGGLNTLPGLYDAVPKRWGRYAITKSVQTKFVPAAFGAIAGLRGAALLGARAK